MNSLIAQDEAVHIIQARSSFGSSIH